MDFGVMGYLADAQVAAGAYGCRGQVDMVTVSDPLPAPPAAPVDYPSPPTAGSAASSSRGQWFALCW